MAMTRAFFYCGLSALAMLAPAAAEATRDDDARVEWLLRIDEARERYDAFATRVVADRERAVETRDARQDARLDDPTLRKGDIIVTQTGLLMFEGSDKIAPDISDFAPIGEARARRSEHSATLLGILRARPAR